MMWIVFRALLANVLSLKITDVLLGSIHWNCDWLEYMHMFLWWVSIICYEWISYLTIDIIFVSTHWGWKMHMLVPALVPVMTVGLEQTITWITTDLLSIRPIGTNFIFQSTYYEFRSWKWFWKCHMQNSGHFVSAAMCYQLFYQVSSWVSF